MSAILALLMVLAVFLIQWYLVSKRRAAAARLAEDTSGELLMHPGHAWARLSSQGLVSVGASDFASNFAGRLAAVRLPVEGTRLRQGEQAWTLVSTGERRLDQVMPVEGKVLAVNRELLRDPSLLQRSPYEQGWILRVRPRRLDGSLHNLLKGKAARAWIDAARSRITARLSPAPGMVAADGGEWLTGFGELLDDADWEAMRQELFPTAGELREAS